MNIFKLREREYHLERLKVLKNKHPEVSHILEFLHPILVFQKEVYEDLKDSEWRKGLKKIYELFDICESYGTQALRDKAQELRALPREELIKRIDRFLKEKDAPDEERFMFLVFLNPFFSKLSEDTEIDRGQWLKSKCPVCGFKPSVSYITDTEDVEGARYLTCVLCHTEWLYNRTQCVRCQNNEDDTLNYYYHTEEPHVMVQACERCNTYIKLIDMRVDGLAVPYLDDVATLSLDLWAKENGFLRFERNLLGL